MIRLVDKTTGKIFGEVAEADVEVMRRALEEEGSTDQDYYINKETLELLIEGGLSAEAQALIRRGLEGSGEFDIGWG